VTFILVSILVVAFILAPIIALKPRGKQSRLEQMRLLARSKGVLYSLRRLPPLKTDTAQSDVLPVYTLAPDENLAGVDEWILRRTQYAHDLNFFKEWDWTNDNRPPEIVQNFLSQNLINLPESVRGISVGHNGIAVFWKEDDEQTLLNLIDFLKKIQALYRDSI
jgi:hypothetical protein